MNDRLHQSPLASMTQKEFDKLRVCRRTNAITKLSRLLLFAGVMFVCAGVQSSTAKAGVTLNSVPTTRTVNAGQSATFAINIARDNYSGSVTLSASNLPAGATASFAPNPTTGKSSTLTLTTKTTTPAGTFQIRVSVKASGLTVAPINVTLIVKPVPSVALSTLPATLSIIAGQNASTEVQILRQNYDGPVYLSAANVPEGVTVAFEANPTNGPKSTMRIYSHGLPHVWGESHITIRAESSSGLVTNALIRLIVNCGIEWVQQFGTAQSDVNESGTGDTYQSVAVDTNGNIYVAGDTFVTGKGSEIWVAKYNNSGQQLWFTSPFGTPGEKDDRVLAIAADSAGNVFVGGYTNGQFTGNVNQGSYDFWIAKYDGTGNQPVLAWVKQDGLPAEDGANGFEIVPDGTGGGRFTTFINDRRLIATYSFTTNGSLSSQGNFPELPSELRDSPGDLALGTDSTVVVAGSREIDEAGLIIRAWVRKYDLLTGALLFDDDISVQDSRSATRVVVDAVGKIYVVGITWDVSLAITNFDTWVRIYDPAQSYAHVETTIESEAEDSINALAIDANGDLIVAGKTSGVLGESNGDAVGKEDAWVARLHGVTADLVWIRQFPVAGDDSIQATAIDANGGIVLAGYTTAFKASTGSQDALLMWYRASLTTRFPPFITGFSNPVTGQSVTSAAVGSTVRIHGGNLGLIGTPPVRFNGTPATSTRIDSRALDSVVPAAARNTTGYVTVTRDCECVRSPTQFTVLP
jgi:hypothetical protein